MASRPPDENEDQARNRWAVIQVVRAGGVVMAILGLLTIEGIVPLPEVAGYVLLALGLVDRLAASEGDIESILEAILADVERCAPGANAATKALLFAAVEGGEAFCMKAADAFIAGMSRDEAREGVAAFNEKRSPSWLPNG